MLGISVRRSAIGVSVALAMVIPRAYANAQPTAVVVRSTGIAEARALELAHEARTRVEAAGREVIAMPPERDALDLSPGVSAGIAAYHDLRPSDALADLDAALASFERVGTGLSGAQLLDALSYRALAAQSLGRAELAIATIDRLLAIEPSYHRDAAHWPPSFRRLLDERRSLAHPASLRLVVVPASSRIVVDGRPDTVVDGSLSIGAGRHVVRVESRGHAPHTFVIDLPLEGDERIVALELDPIANLRDPGPPETPTESLVASARTLGAELVVVDAVVVGNTLRASLDDTHEDFHQNVLVDASLDAATIVDRLFRHEDQAPPPGDAARASEREPGTPRRVRRRRALLLSAAAAVALAASVSIPLALRSRDDFVGRWQRDAR